VNVNADVIRVVPATHTPDGKPLEPEERPVVRDTQTGSVLSFNTGQVINAAQPTIIQQETTVGELALGLRRTCATCKHWDNLGWQAFRRECDKGEIGERAFVNEIRAAIDSSQDIRYREQHAIDPNDPNDVDIEHALDGLGLCRALTEIRSRFQQRFFPVVTHPWAGCPDEKEPDGTCVSDLYQPRDRGAATAASRAYDKLMEMARTKAPTK